MGKAAVAPINYWTVPRLWGGATVVILGGGPSLTQEQVDCCRDLSRRVIAINNSLELAAWADAHWFCDRRWFEWYGSSPDYVAFQGIKVTIDEGVARNHPEIHCLKNTGRDGLESERTGVRNGRNSGYQAINLAVHLGAKRIVLLGYDMQVATDGRTHWHGGHAHPIRSNVFETSMLPVYPSLVEPLASLGVEVLNATPGSALTVFPMKPLAECL